MQGNVLRWLPTLNEQQHCLSHGKAMARQRGSPSSLGCSKSGMRASLTFAFGNLNGFWQSTKVTCGTTRNAAAPHGFARRATQQPR